MSGCLLLTLWFTACCPPSCPPLAPNVPAAWRSWGGNCTQFGQSLQVKGNTEIRTVTSPPISPNRLLGGRPFYFSALNSK